VDRSSPHGPSPIGRSSRRLAFRSSGSIPPTGGRTGTRLPGDPIRHWVAVLGDEWPWKVWPRERTLGMRQQRRLPQIFDALACRWAVSGAFPSLSTPSGVVWSSEPIAYTTARLPGTAITSSLRSWVAASLSSRPWLTSPSQTGGVWYLLREPSCSPPSSTTRDSCLRPSTSHCGSSLPRPSSTATRRAMSS
jgi:hypothetical protein